MPYGYNASSALQFDTNSPRHHLQEPLPFDRNGGEARKPQHRFSYESSSTRGQVCGNNSSRLSSILSNVVEAHELALKQQPTATRDFNCNGIHESDHPHPDPILNEEAEGAAVQEAVANLRVLLRLGDTDHNDATVDYYELLAVADYLERLGLDVYFRQEIESILDRVFKVWTLSSSLNETAVRLGDLECVGLAFYLLRSHEYDVQPNVFQLYRKESNGNFYKRPQSVAVGDQSRVEGEVPSADVFDLLNLLRSSDLRFRCDVGLQDAYSFASMALRNLLDGGAQSLSEKTAAEVSYRLKYPWAINLRMLETRQTVLTFQTERIMAKFSTDRFSSKVLSLMLSIATQLVNGYIPKFREEIEALYGWIEECGLAKVSIRSKMVLLPYLLGMGYEMPQARYSYTRMALSKLVYFSLLLDDLYDVGASLDHLVVFNDAVKRWDPSVLERLPKDQGPMSIRVIYEALYDNTTSWAKQSSIWYGRDLLQTFVRHWIVRLEIYTTERNWLETGFKMDSDTYMNEFAKWSWGTELSAPLIYYAMPAGAKVNPSFFETRPDMKAVFAICKAGRFFNDATTYKYEQLTESKGKMELVHILMEENPQFTEQDAVERAEQYGQSALQEATEEILQCKENFPHPDFKASILVSYKTSMLIYYFVDGMRNRNHVLSKLIEPLPNLPLDSEL